MRLLLPNIFKWISLASSLEDAILFTVPDLGFVANNFDEDAFRSFVDFNFVGISKGRSGDFESIAGDFCFHNKIVKSSLVGMLISPAQHDNNDDRGDGNEQPQNDKQDNEFKKT